MANFSRILEFHDGRLLPDLEKSIRGKAPHRLETNFLDVAEDLKDLFEKHIEEMTKEHVSQSRVLLRTMKLIEKHKDVMEKMKSIAVAKPLEDFFKVKSCHLWPKQHLDTPKILLTEPFLIEDFTRKPLRAFRTLDTQSFSWKSTFSQYRAFIRY